MSDSETPWPAARQASQSFDSWSLLKLMSIESVMPSNHLIPFSSCLQSFPPSGPFLMSRLFASGGQSIGASASVLPMNIEDWSPLGWTGLISLLSKGLLRVFSNTTVQASILWQSAFFIVQLSHPYMTTGETIALTYMCVYIYILFYILFHYAFSQHNECSSLWSTVKVNSLSHVRLFATPWTVAHQGPPPMGLSRQESWSGLPFPSPGDLPDPGIKPGSLHCRQTL